MQAIKNNEAIAETDASIKNEKSKSEILSNQQMYNTVIAAEAITILDLENTVVKIQG